MPLHRFTEWPTRLHAFLIERDLTPFAYGSNDCALLACDAIVAMTGTDIAQPYRNRYTTKLGSLRAIRRVTGGSSVEATAEHAAAQYGMPEINSRMASRGDLILMPNGPDQMLAIVALNGKEAIAVSENGLIHLPLTQAMKAWKV